MEKPPLATPPPPGPVGSDEELKWRLALIEEHNKASAEPLHSRGVVFNSVLAVVRGLGDEHAVERCLQARVALELIRNSPPYDAILCDMMMPEMTGEQLYEAVLATDPEQARRIIFMTGGAFTEGTRQFLERVRNPQLTKPFKVEEVETLLASLLG